MNRILVTAILLTSCAAVLQSAETEERPSRRREGQKQEQREGRNRRSSSDVTNAERYTLAQAMSDKAQLHTIAFNGLAFLTGDFGAATFIPPGKVCDYFGFQYMRDIDAAGKGHNPIFLNRICANVLSILDAEQRDLLKSLAEKQSAGLTQLASKRLPLIKAFCVASETDDELDKSNVMAYVSEIFALDMALSLERAAVFGKIAVSLSKEQKEALGKLKFGDFNSWPEVDAQPYRLPRGSEKMLNVAYMTYASEFFSFYAGSVEADTYFCPERHGTYFGGFYMKDMPVMGQKDMDISTSITGDSGAEFLATLTPEQRSWVTETVELQRQALAEVAILRQKISEQLRLYLAGKKPDTESLMELGRRYGELDGEMSYYYADAFAKVAKTLTTEQRQKLMKLRNLDNYVSAPYYIYSAAQKNAPEIGDISGFFKVRK